MACWGVHLHRPRSLSASPPSASPPSVGYMIGAELPADPRATQRAAGEYIVAQLTVTTACSLRTLAAHFHTRPQSSSARVGCLVSHSSVLPLRKNSRRAASSPRPATARRKELRRQRSTATTSCARHVPSARSARSCGWRGMRSGARHLRTCRYPGGGGAQSPPSRGRIGHARLGRSALSPTSSALMSQSRAAAVTS